MSKRVRGVCRRCGESEFKIEHDMRTDPYGDVYITHVLICCKCGLVHSEDAYRALQRMVARKAREAKS